jgi:hypothetical protein
MIRESRARRARLSRLLKIYKSFRVAIKPRNSDAANQRKSFLLKLLLHNGFNKKLVFLRRFARQSKRNEKKLSSQN